MPNEPVDVFQHIDMRGPTDCWRWLGPWGGRDGKERRPYFQAGKRRTMAYRWVWELVTGELLPQSQPLLHSCDQGGWPIGCCNPHHMRKGTHDENMADMVSRERHGLPRFAVNGIRKLLDEGRPQADIAALYGVSREAISAISTGRSHQVRPQGASADTTTGDTTTGSHEPTTNTC